jgi:hypothetical protein
MRLCCADDCAHPVSNITTTPASAVAEKLGFSMFIS